MSFALKRPINSRFLGSDKNTTVSAKIVKIEL